MEEHQMMQNLMGRRVELEGKREKFFFFENLMNNKMKHEMI